MKLNSILAIALLLLCSGSMLAQGLMPLPKGTHITSRTEKKSIRGVPVPTKMECEVGASSKDGIQFAIERNGSFQDRFTLGMVKEGLYADRNMDGHFITPVRQLLVLRPEGFMELYILGGSDESPEVREVVAIASKSDKFKDVSKASDAYAKSFDAKAMVGEVLAVNAAKDAEIAAKKKAEEEAKAKAAEERRIAEEKAQAERAQRAKEKAEAEAKAMADADLCAPTLRYAKMAPTQFKEIWGKVDMEETDEEDEEKVYYTTEVMPLFEEGRATPLYFDGKYQLSFQSKGFSTEAEANAFLDLVLGKINPCFKNKGGYTYRLDSGIHMYTGSSSRLGIMSKKDMWSDSPQYLVIFTISKK